MRKAVIVVAFVVGVIGTVLLLAPHSHADPNQSDLSRPFGQYADKFVGTWRAHGEVVTIDADGSGTETASRGTLNFKLPFVQQGPSGAWDYALGNVVSGFLQRGAFVSVQLVDGGKGMLFSAGGGDNGFPFCKMVNGSAANSFDCGA
jgi:hypothetical protein